MWDNCLIITTYENLTVLNIELNILMNINYGVILSMVSLPDFDLNKRQNINDLKYINRATKAVYELGSVFKTFTFAAGLNESIIDINTNFKNLIKSSLFIFITTPLKS